MAESRPSMQSVQRTLIMGLLLGLIFGCLLGGAFGLYYAWQVNPATYGEGAYPNDLASGYQSHYMNMAVDSYMVNKQVDYAQQRLQSFDDAVVVKALGDRSVAFVSNGQTVEAQSVNELAAQLKIVEEWPPEMVAGQVSVMAVEYQDDPAQAQAVNSFGASLGVVPADVPADSTGTDAGEQPATTTPPPPPTDEGGFPWSTLLYCLLGLLVIVIVVLLIGRWYFTASRRPPTESQVDWEGEGPAPVKQWTGTYTLGHDTYDEFFTIETLAGDFLGESGMGILEAVPGSSPKQVTAFDVGLFDKTDITTLSRVVMSEQAFNDPAVQAKIEANPQAEAVLAEPGTTFDLETSALRVSATIDDLEYGGANEYFEKLSLTLNVFIKEGVDLRIGSMDVPEQYQ